LSINRYKETVYEPMKYDDPKVILKKLNNLEKEIISEVRKLEDLLN